MKKALSVFWLLTITAVVFAQQSNLKGQVSIFNSQFETGKRKYVANAQVEEAFGKTHPTITDQDGTFRLSLVGFNAMEKVFFTVNKAGYEVVNTNALQAVAGQTDTQRVFMVPLGRIAENKLKFYKINREASEKALTEKIHTLEKEIQAAQTDKALLVQLQEEYASLQAKFEKTEEVARDWANRYARVNLDDASLELQRAFQYYQRGELEAALNFLQEVDMEQQANAILKAQSQNNQITAEYNKRAANKNLLKKQTIEALRFKAGLHQTKYEVDKAESCYVLLMALDSFDMDNLMPYAEFLQFQNQTDKAVHYLNKCIPLARNKAEKIELYLRIGLVFHLSTQWEAADTAFMAVERIFENLTSKDSSTYAGQIGIAGTITAYRYQLDQQPKKAMKIIEKSIALLETAKTDFDVDLAIIYAKLVLGTYYSGLEKFAEGEKVLLEANDKIIQLASLYPDQEEDYALFAILIQTGLGDLYYTLGRMTEAEKLFSSAESTMSKLVSVNAKKYEYISLGIIESLGHFHLTNKNPEEAAAYYRKSIEVCDRIEKYNPKQFRLLKAISIQNLGDYYLRKNDISQALSLFKEALNLHEELPIDGQKKIISTIASLHQSIGKCLAAMQNWEEAKSMFNDAIKRYQDLVELGWVEYVSDLAYVLRLQGGLFYQIAQLDSSENYLVQCTTVYDFLEKSEDSRRYLLSSGEALQQLGSVHQLQGKWQDAEKDFLKSLAILQEAAQDTDSLQARQYEANVWYMLGSGYSYIQAWDKAKKAWQKSLELYIELDKHFPNSYGITVAANIGLLANCYKSLGETAIARTMYKDALQRFEQLNNTSPLYTASYFSVLLMDIADLAIASDSIAKGVAGYLRAGLMVKNILFQGGNNYTNWQHLYRAYYELNTQVDTLFERKQFKQAERIQAQLISMITGLRTIYDSIQYYEVLQLGKQSYLSLFVKKFQQSEKCARQALYLAPSQTWIKTNLAHALLFQNQLAAATTLYESLHAQPIVQDFSYSEACLKDFDELEAAGITHPDIVKIRQLLHR